METIQRTLSPLSQVMPRHFNTRISQDLTNTAQLWQARRLTNDWVVRHPSVHPFSSVGAHKSVNPVYPIGTPVYVRVSTLQRNVFTLIQRTNPSESTSKIATTSIKQLPVATESWQAFSRDDLYELVSLLKKYNYGLANHHKISSTIKAIENLTITASSWHLRSRVIDLLALNAEIPAVAHWLRNTEGWIPIDSIHADTILEGLKTNTLKDTTLPSAFDIKRHLHNLRKTGAHHQDLDPNYCAIFKNSKESYHELLPAAVATALNLDSCLVPTEIIGLREGHVLFPTENSTGVYSTNFFPTGVLQPFVKKGTKPSKFVIDTNKPSEQINPAVTKALPLNEYQIASLFIALTKQSDIHNGNAYFTEDNQGKKHICFFDIARSMLPEGLIIRKKGEHKISLRSFLMTFPQFDTPLTKETIELIKSWNLEKIRKQFIVSDKDPGDIKDLIEEIEYYLDITNTLAQDKELIPYTPPANTSTYNEWLRHDEKALTKALRKTITQKQLDGLMKRITALKKLVSRSDTSAPSMRQVYEETLPLEMELIHLYTKVLGNYKGMLCTAKVTIEDLLEKGINNGTLLEKEVSYWKSRVIEIATDPKFSKLTSWIYSSYKPTL